MLARLYQATELTKRLLIERDSMTRAVVSYRAETERYKQFVVDAKACHRWLFCSCRRKARKVL